MNILLVYATNSGGTQIASQIVTKALTKKNHLVIVKQASETTPQDLGQYDVIILGSPTWDYGGLEGQPHADFIALMEKCKGITAENKLFAIFGLGDSSYTHFCGAVDHLEEFVKSLKGKRIVDSLKIDGFFFDQKKNTELLKSWTEGVAKTLSPQ